MYFRLCIDLMHILPPVTADMMAPNTRGMPNGLTASGRVRLQTLCDWNGLKLLSVGLEFPHLNPYSAMDRGREE